MTIFDTSKMPFSREKKIPDLRSDFETQYIKNAFVKWFIFLLSINIPHTRVKIRKSAHPTVYTVQYVLYSTYILMVVRHCRRNMNLGIKT